MEGCFLCQVCNKLRLYKTAEQLREHMVTNYTPSVLLDCEPVGNFECSDCDSVVYGFERDLTSHNIYWHRTFPARCQLCPKVFQCKEDLAGHIKETHSPTSYCEPCAYIFDGKEDLRRHNLIISYDQGYRWTACYPFHVDHDPTVQSVWKSYREKMGIE